MSIKINFKKNAGPQVNQITTFSDSVVAMETPPVHLLSRASNLDVDPLIIAAKYVMPDNAAVIGAVSNTIGGNEYLLVSGLVTNELYLIPAMYMYPNAVSYTATTPGYAVGAIGVAGDDKSKSAIRTYDGKATIKLLASDVLSVAHNVYEVNDVDISSMFLTALNTTNNRNIRSELSVIDITLTAPISIPMWQLQNVGNMAKEFIYQGVANVTAFSIPLQR